MIPESGPEFALIETMRWSAAEGYYLLQRHLDRLAASARHFGMECDVDTVRVSLERAAKELSGTRRVRLVYDRDRRCTITTTPIPDPDPGAVVRYAISPRPVDSTDPHRRHKTTRREVLDNERVRLAAQTGCDEVIFLNERGELTEGSYTSLFVELGGVLLTPPLWCGLLDGTLRREMLEGQDFRVEERVLRPHVLDEADAVYLGNSVRGLMRARHVGDG